ncbi:MULTISPECIES: hypothetical protein [unclassified Enterobacter cloacae complex]|uniref:hypothetical protein n=1 Tax=unclassified Enterobacter cloacae complex TaxID=2757714 RepID=UPI0021034135|nr:MULTISPECIES: hypothetical protein [unclassified Enterobacter cloacae complex]MCE1514339.1 hypothetical protein [Enterobacter hormaechei]
MSTITKEQAQKIIEAADEVITALAGTNEDVHPESDSMLRLWDDLNDRYAPPEVVRELARIALASLEAEPAIHRWRRVTVEPYGPYPWHYGNFIGFSKPVEGIEDEYFYSAPPAPVSMKDHQIRELVNELRDIAVEYHGTQQLRERIARTVRAAMLQGADGNSPVIPDGWVMVPEEPTHEMLEAGDEQFGTYDVYRRMIAASPQQK